MTLLHDYHYNTYHDYDIIKIPTPTNRYFLKHKIYDLIYDFGNENNIIETMCILIPEEEENVKEFKQKIKNQLLKPNFLKDKHLFSLCGGIFSKYKYIILSIEKYKIVIPIEIIYKILEQLYHIILEELDANYGPRYLNI